MKPTLHPNIVKTLRFRSYELGNFLTSHELHKNGVISKEQKEKLNARRMTAIDAGCSPFTYGQFVLFPNYPQRKLP